MDEVRSTRPRSNTYRRPDLNADKSVIPSLVSTPTAGPALGRRFLAIELVETTFGLFRQTSRYFTSTVNKNVFDKNPRDHIPVGTPTDEMVVSIQSSRRSVYFSVRAILIEDTDQGQTPSTDKRIGSSQVRIFPTKGSRRYRNAHKS